MRNILSEEPTEAIHGRLLFSASFVSDADIEDKKVLDIGCGFGWFELYALGKKVCRVIGVEPSDNDLQTARRFLDDPRVSLMVGGATNLPVDDASIDTVVCWEVLEHIPKGSEPRMFTEAARVLCDGGVFYLSTPNRSFLSTILDPAWTLVGHRHYRVEEVRRLAVETGFKAVAFCRAGGWWEVLGWWNLYISKWVLRRKPLFVNAIERRLDVEYGLNNKGFTNNFCKFVKE
ncbi:MAG: class I SAM-dependent methyltransferase [Thermaerobacter sp.]|nr:class I SAM-dependent methyltransferase [Thermaerobacter sp.]